MPVCTGVNYKMERVKYMSCKCNCYDDKRDECVAARVCVNGCEDKVMAESMAVQQPTMVHICGKVCNQCGQPARGVSVSLVKECCDSCRKIATAMTDCEGMYEFRVCIDGCRDMYKVVAHGQKPCRKDGCGCQHGHQHGCGQGCEQHRQCGCVC